MVLSSFLKTPLYMVGFPEAFLFTFANDECVFAGLPCIPISSTPLRMPQVFLMINPIARPMAALAISPGLKAPRPQFIWRLLRIGPFTNHKGAKNPY